MGEKQFLISVEEPLFILIQSKLIQNGENPYVLQPLDKLDWADLEKSNLKERVCCDLYYTILLNKMPWWMELEGHGASSVTAGELAEWETAVGQGLGTCGG